jgi:nucleotide-binding universal stress UspA family protein
LRQVVRQEHRDLLIVGSGRDAELGHVGLGPDAGELLAHLECPLTIAPSAMADRPKAGLVRVAVGFDGEPESLAALDRAASIATAAGADLYVRGVVGDSDRAGLATEKLLRGRKGRDENRVSSLYERSVAAARATGARAHVDVGRGSPAPILSELGDHVDLLVIGSGHSGPAGRVVLGSTGRALVHDAPYPIVVVPRP